MQNTYVKKFLLVVVLFLVSSLGESQVLISILFGDKLNSDKLEFGLEGGVNWYTMKGPEDAGRSHAFNLGFYYDIKMKYHITRSIYTRAGKGADLTGCWKIRRSLWLAYPAGTA